MKATQFIASRNRTPERMLRSTLATHVSLGWAKIKESSLVNTSALLCVAAGRESSPVSFFRALLESQLLLLHVMSFVFVYDFCGRVFFREYVGLFVSEVD